MKKEEKKKLETFDLFGTKWTIEIKPRTEDSEGEWLFGIAKGDTREIEVSTQSRQGKPLPKEEIRLSRMHEIVHAMLGTGGYHNPNDDEPLVEWISRCIISLRDQNII